MANINFYAVIRYFGFSGFLDEVKKDMQVALGEGVPSCGEKAEYGMLKPNVAERDDHMKTDADYFLTVLTCNFWLPETEISH